MRTVVPALLLSCLLAPTADAEPITTVEAANALAAKVLAKHLADHRDESKKPLAVDDFNIALKFPRSRWSARALQRAGDLERKLSHAAGFLAQLASDWGAGAVDLHVLVVPDGEMVRTAGASHASLYIPLGEQNETELRTDFDEGKFIPLEHWWSPLSHMETKKRRALWRLKNKLRLVFRKAARALIGDIDQLRGKRGEALRQATRRLVARAIGDKVEGGDGAGLRDRILSKLAAAEDDQAVIGFLKRWRENAADPREAEAAAEYMAGALQSGNKITDERDVWSLVQVETFDAVTVAPDDVLKRHGAPLLNEVHLKGLRVTLIHVTSVDTVAVVPNLARMLLGGTTAERAEALLPAEEAKKIKPAGSSLTKRLGPLGD